MGWLPSDPGLLEGVGGSRCVSSAIFLGFSWENVLAHASRRRLMSEEMSGAHSRCVSYFENSFDPSQPNPTLVCRLTPDFLVQIPRPET